jgi:putative ABC transport system permease protein
MFLRLVADSFTRRPRRKVLTAAALSLGMAVVTAALSVSLDVGDRLASEFRSLGANLLVTPQADSLPLEIGGVDYRPVNAGAYLPEADLPKIKTVFWHNNIIAFAPALGLSVRGTSQSRDDGKGSRENRASWPQVSLIGTWANHPVRLVDQSKWSTGIEKTNPWWHLMMGRWFSDDALECVVGKNLARKQGALQNGQRIFAGLPIGDNFVIDRGPSSPPLFLKAVGILDSGGPEDDEVVVPIAIAQQLANQPGQYRQLYVSALTKPEDDFARRDPKTMKPDEFERWSCSPYVSSIAYSIKQVLPGTDVRVIRRVAEGEGTVLTRVRALLWMVTFAALLAAALAVGASAAASVIERRTEIGLMKALGASSGTVGFLLAAEQLLLAFVGGGIGYSLGIILARLVGQKIFGVAPAPSLLVLVAVLALAAGVTLLGSAIPLRRASRYEPAPILRGE